MSSDLAVLASFVSHARKLPSHFRGRSYGAANICRRSVQSRNRIGIRNQSVTGDGLSTHPSMTFQRMWDGHSFSSESAKPPSQPDA
jgi:hypothetical protein